MTGSIVKSTYTVTRSSNGGRAGVSSLQTSGHCQSALRANELKIYGSAETGDIAHGNCSGSCGRGIQRDRISSLLYGRHYCPTKYPAHLVGGPEINKPSHNIRWLSYLELITPIACVSLNFTVRIPVLGRYDLHPTNCCYLREGFTLGKLRNKGASISLTLSLKAENTSLTDKTVTVFSVSLLKSYSQERKSYGFIE